jgi:hypothetical protein
MTGKVINSNASGLLVLIIPIAFLIVLLFQAWPVLLALFVLSVTAQVWQQYQWQKWSQQVNPYFNQLIKDNQGCLTPLDLAMKANLSGSAAQRYLDKKAEEFGAQRREYEDKGTVYYFLTASALGSIFEESVPPFELEDEEDEDILSPPAALTASVGTEPLIQKPPHPVHEEAPQGELQEPPESLVEEQSDSSVEPAPQGELQEPPESLVEEQPDSSVEPPPQGEIQELPSVEEESEASVEVSEAEEVKAETELSKSQTSKLPAFLQPKDDVLEESADESALDLKPLIQAELAKRLDVHASTVGKRKSEEDFPEWSQSRDPEGIAWKYDPETKEFTPIETVSDSAL